MGIKLLARILISVAGVAFAASSSLIKREVVTAFSSEEQTAIVEKHNEYRRKVSPTASNMAELKWDADLTKKAQDLADGCVFEHSITYGIGQNLYVSTGERDVIAPVTSWHDEVKNYTYEDNKCDEGAICGHYTQVIWASTTAVGCGIKHCPSLIIPHVGEWNGWMFVCNYKPR
ncbi:Peptidase inhibitor 16 [Holothuria leucospilota]|uniref:Peptidase inhibitor 16 n=1 Tax=Holothuria leucospilota TaxID=206669 RepID=A0A9Q0YJ85_HOLLE|nr:Peptidase inhibitor 16 [Holothuria leucospilota]